jgi:phage gpG-like protein
MSFKEVPKMSRETFLELTGIEVGMTAWRGMYCAITWRPTSRKITKDKRKRSLKGMQHKMTLKGADAAKKDLGDRANDLLSGGWVRGPAAEFHQKFLNVTAEHFDRLKHGGTWRGVTWKYFSPRSFGQKRPSGAIIKPGDSILQDTGRLLHEAGRGFVPQGPQRVEFVTNLSYAALHNEGGHVGVDELARDIGSNIFSLGHNIPARPFQFFTQDDISDLREFTREWLNG